jgi:hypothetical protein
MIRIQQEEHPMCDWLHHAWGPPDLAHEGVSTVVTRGCLHCEWYFEIVIYPDWDVKAYYSRPDGFDQNEPLCKEVSGE